MIRRWPWRFAYSITDTEGGRRVGGGETNEFLFVIMRILYIWVRNYIVILSTRYHRKAVYRFKKYFVQRQRRKTCVYKRKKRKKNKKKYENFVWENKINTEILLLRIRTAAKRKSRFRVSSIFRPTYSLRWC